MTENFSNSFDETPPIKHKIALPDIHYEFLSFQQQHDKLDKRIAELEHHPVYS